MNRKTAKTNTLDIQGTRVAVVTSPQGDHISLTDMLRAKDEDFFIADWLRNRNTVEFLGIWESIYNLAFNTANSPQLEVRQVSTAKRSASKSAHSR
jgi:hypothetical protein